MQPFEVAVALPSTVTRSAGWRRSATGVICAVGAVMLVILVSTSPSAPSENDAFSKLEVKMPSPYPDEVWVYSGRTAAGRRDAVEGGGVVALQQLIRRDHFETVIKPLKSLGTASLRSAFWNKNNKVTVFPPLSEYPTLSHRSSTDLREWVAGGGNLVFVGSYMLEMFLNDIFRWNLHGGYSKGPYFLNPRAAMNSPFAYLSQTLPELEGQLVGVETRSLPQPGGHCIYDSHEVCMAFFVSYHLGTVTYLGDGFSYLDEFEKPDAEKWVKLLHAGMMV